MVKEAKSPVKNLVRYRYAEGFNSGVKGLSVGWLMYLLTVLRSLGNEIHKNTTPKVITFLVVVSCFTVIITEIDEWLFSNTTRILNLYKAHWLPYVLYIRSE
jgi:hypothetical protein